MESNNNKGGPGRQYYIINSEAEFSRRMQDVLSQMPPKLRQMTQYSACANAALQVLVRGGDPYTIIEHLIAVIEGQNRAMLEIMQRTPPAQ